MRSIEIVYALFPLFREANGMMLAFILGQIDRHACR